MKKSILEIIQSLESIKDLAQFEENAKRMGQHSPEVVDAIRKKSTDLGREILISRTGLELDNLSPAEEEIVIAASEYIGVQKRKGKDAGRTLNQLRDRDLIEAAEVSVMKSKPTQGFQALEEADLLELSYESIIVKHPNEFSARAVWFSRKTLGLPNDSDRPPTLSVSLIQTRTEILVEWLRELSGANQGKFPEYTNADSAAALGMAELSKSGRAFGNILSRLDYSCYLAGLPPIGLTAEKPFEKAWSQEDRDWAFPVEQMKIAAQSKIWTDKDFEKILYESRKLSGRAHILWRQALNDSPEKVRNWSLGLSAENSEFSEKATRNPAWSREELILALDLYLRYRASPPAKNSSEIAELSAVMHRMRNDSNSLLGNSTYRNENGIYMKMMNFRRFDSQYTAEGKSGLTRGGQLDKIIWDEFADDPIKLAKAVSNIKLALVNDNETDQSADKAFDVGELDSEISQLEKALEDSLSVEEELKAALARIAAIEQKYLGSTPEVKHRIGKTIERGPIGALMKKVAGFKCQLCGALNHNPVGFLKPNGEPYVEAHHVMPVSKLEQGSLGASNIMVLCANHHRQLHYGGIRVEISATSFNLTIEGTRLEVPKLIAY